MMIGNTRSASLGCHFRVLAPRACRRLSCGTTSQPPGPVAEAACKRWGLWCSPARPRPAPPLLGRRDALQRPGSSIRPPNSIRRGDPRCARAPLVSLATMPAAATSSCSQSPCLGPRSSHALAVSMQCMTMCVQKHNQSDRKHVGCTSYDKLPPPPPQILLLPSEAVRSQPCALVHVELHGMGSSCHWLATSALAWLHYATAVTSMPGV